MATRIATSARNAAAAAILALIDAGSGPGVVEIRTGTQPANPNTTATGTLLATLTLNDPAFGSPTSGASAMGTTPNPAGTGVADGTVGWARIKDSNGNAVIDLSVSGPGGGGEVVLSAATIATGVAVSVTALTYTQPV